MDQSPAASQRIEVTPPPVAAPPATPAETGLVFACELPCISCGYDLRTMRLEAQCPECGKACAESLAGLAAAHAEDLARVRRGVVLMLLAALAPMFVVGLGALGIVLQMLGQGGLIRFGDEAVPWVIGLMCAVAGPIVALGGVIRLTEPVRPVVESGLPSPHPGGGTRQRLRSVSIVYMIASIAAFAFWVYLVQSFSPGAAVFWGASLTIALTALAWTGRNVVVCRFLETLLRLGCAARLARWFCVLSWFAAAMFACVALISGAVLLLYVFREWLNGFDTDVSSSWSGAIFFLFSVIYSLGSLGFLVWGIAWPISLALVVRRIRAVERVIAGRGGPLVRATERPAGG